MSIDLNKSAELIRGSLLEESRTWPEYAAQRQPLMNTLLWVTLPAVVAAAILSFLLNLIFDGLYVFGGSGFGGLISALIGGLLGIAIWAGAAYFFAGLFSSTPADAPEQEVASEGAEENTAAPAQSPASFDQAFAAVTFGFLPGLVGSVLGALPWIGWLLMLAAMVYALMTLYRAIPVFLPVSQENRVKHFVATFLASLVATMVLSTILGTLFVSSRVIDARSDFESNMNALEEQLDAADNGQGIPDLLGMGGQVDYLEAASADEYDPPRNGKLKSAQVERTVRYLQRTAELRERTGDRLKQIAERSEGGDESPSLNDLFKGIRGAMTVGTAEMQVVKADGGNWAEHEWVKNALYQAQTHRDLNEITEHNYALYQKYQEALDELL